jgi:integrative and conjugative element protein (TIGR02256 family)
VLTALSDAASKCAPNETGGFLIGLRRDTSIEVTGNTSEGLGDRATRSTFERAGRHHQREAERAWKESGGFQTLVGDWHSHPVGAGEPSLMDELAWGDLLKAMKRPGVAIIVSNSGPNVYLLPSTSGVASIACELSVAEADDLIFRPKNG